MVSWRFVTISALFVACLLTANVVAVKLVAVGAFVVPAGVVVFPLSYVIGDVLTEVWGYAAARRVIWLGFAGNAVMVAAIAVAGALPPVGFWRDQPAWDAILGQTPRLLVASFVAYLCGEFANSFVLAKMKVATRGRWLWTRTIGSTLVGQALDTAVFVSLAFAGTIPGGVLGHAMLGQWAVKVAYEVLATPVTYAVVRWLKHAERVDVYDDATDFSPLRL